MKHTELEQYQRKFELRRQLQKREFKDLELRRKQFVRDYPESRIKRLKLDEYIVGKGQETFCNRLERELEGLGRITGSSARKFGVWYGHNGKKSTVGYKHTKKFGVSFNQAFLNVKQDVVDLLEAGRKGAYAEIDQSELCNLVRGKILSVYFPKKYLNIFVHDHLDYFLSHLNLMSGADTILEKQQTILDFKNADAVMKSWSTQEFMSFLYWSFDSPEGQKYGGNAKGERGKANTYEFPPLDQVIWSLLDKTLKKPSPPKKSKTNQKGKVKGGNEERNKRLGDRGEAIVLQAELERIAIFGFKESRIEHTASTNDKAGFDIESVEEDGTSRYIEVKSTTSRPGKGQFLISSNEKDQAESLDNYWVYLVFQAQTASPSILRIKKPFSKKNKANMRIEPSQYRISYSFD